MTYLNRSTARVILGQAYTPETIYGNATNVVDRTYI